MPGRTVLTTLSGSAPHERLQVALKQQRGGRVVLELSQQHYAEGIGWYDQRGLELDPRQLRQLQSILGGSPAFNVMNDERAPAILPFPGPVHHAPTRSAAGEIA